MNHCLRILFLVLLCMMFANAGESKKTSDHDDTQFEISSCCARYIIASATAGMLGVAWVIPSVLLPMIGFGAAGVSTGSLAALWQTWFAGAVGSGSVFAMLQAIAAAGVSGTSVVLSGAACGATAAAFCDMLNERGWCSA